MPSPSAFFSAVIGSSFFALCSPLSAQKFTWTGATGGSWSTAANWTGGIPANSTTTAVEFGPATTLATTQNISGGLSLNSLAFTADAGSYTVGGSQPLIFSGTAPSISSFSTAVGSITVSVPLQFTQTVTVTGDAGDFTGQLKLTGVISGTGGMQWNSGIGTISGTNTYSGGTTISGGAFSVSKSSSLGTGAVVINGGALQIQNNTAISRALTISGAGAEGLPAIHSSTGSNSWSGAVTLAGATTIGSFKSAGASVSSLQLTSNLTLPGSPLTVDARADSTTRLSGLIAGTGELIKSGTGTLLLNNNSNSFTGNVRVEAGILDTQTGSDKLGNIANTLTVVVGSTLQNTNLDVGRSVILEGIGFVNLTAASSMAIAADISGPSGLKVSSGFVELSGSNTFSGGLTVGIGSGTAGLNVFDTVAFGAAGNVVTIDAARINFQPKVASFSLGASQALTFAAGGATFGVATGKTITVAGDLSGDGKLNLRGLTDNVNGGTFILAGNNSFTGGILVSRTTLLASSDAALGGTAGALDITNGTFRATGSFAISGTRRSTFIGNATIDTQGFDLTFGQPILGNGQLVKIGTGGLTLAATSPSETSVILSAGSITTSAVNALGTGGIGLSEGTTLSLGANQQLRDIDGSGTIVTLPGSTLTLTGQSHFFSGSLTGGALIALSGIGASYSPPATPDSDFSLDGGQILAMNDLTLSAAQTIEITASGGKLAALDDSTLTVNSVISGVGGLTTLSYNSDFAPTGDGVVALNASNTYTGGTTIPSGVLIAGADGALGAGAITLSGGTLSATGTRTFAQPMTLGAPVNFDTSRLSGDAMTFDGDWTLTANRTLDVENITTLNGGLLGGAFEFTKAGSGTLTFNGISTHTGTTAVADGTLSGTGTIGPVSLSSNATLAPGNSFGTLHTGNVTFSAGSTFALHFASPAIASQLAVTGAVTLEGHVELALVPGITPVTASTFIVIDNDGSDPIETLGGTALFSFAGNSLSEGETFTVDGASWTISYLGGTGNDVTLTVIPATVAAELALVSFSLGTPPGGHPGKQVQGILSGPPDAVVRMQRSSDLIDWTPLTTITLNEAGTSTFDVTDPLATERAFYRMVTP